MYCSRCRRQLFYKNLDSDGWCENCDGVVHVSRCKVSYWILLATFTLQWVM